LIHEIKKSIAVKCMAFPFLEVVSFPQCDDLKIRAASQYGKCHFHVTRILLFLKG